MLACSFQLEVFLATEVKDRLSRLVVAANGLHLVDQKLWARPKQISTEQGPLYLTSLDGDIAGSLPFVPERLTGEKMGHRLRF